MKSLFCNIVLISSLIAFPGMTLFAAHPGNGEIISGHYSRQGNNGSSSSTAGNNIYIKFFENRWIAMLYLPYPSATVVESSIINKVFETAKLQVSSSSYLRGEFGHLMAPVTLHFERYQYLEDRIIFECGSLSPCTIKLGERYLELIKPGVINEHIIRYDYVSGE
jgi:hypothetical protein